MWTEFYDMHSGGGAKEQWTRIYIEAPRSEATAIFCNRFSHNPYRITCSCCGEDYSISEDESINQLTGYERNCTWDKVAEKFIEQPRGKYPVLTIDKYEDRDNVLFIRADEIKPEERKDIVLWD